MFIVVSYDIPDDRRRTKVMKALKDFGRHVQYSVFECNLKHADIQRMQQRLKKLINPKEDNIRFYPIAQDDALRRQVWGEERSPELGQAWYLVGGEVPQNSPKVASGSKKVAP